VYGKSNVDAVPWLHYWQNSQFCAV